MEENSNKELNNEKIEKYMERIFFEIRWIRQNMNPPVNYFLITTLSIISAIITTLILIR